MKSSLIGQDYVRNYYRGNTQCSSCQFHVPISLPKFVWYAITILRTTRLLISVGLIFISSYCHIQLSNQSCRAVFSSDLHLFLDFFIESFCHLFIFTNARSVTQLADTFARYFKIHRAFITLNSLLCFTVVCYLVKVRARNWFSGYDEQIEIEICVRPFYLGFPSGYKISHIP